MIYTILLVIVAWAMVGLFIFAWIEEHYDGTPTWKVTVLYMAWFGACIAWPYVAVRMWRQKKADILAEKLTS